MKVDRSLIKDILIGKKEKEKAEESARIKADISDQKVREEKNIKDISVKISKEAAVLDKSKKAMKEMADVDMAKVEFYKKLLEKGEYKVDSEKLAKKMLDIFEGRES